MKPGATTAPDASMILAALSLILPISAILPSLTAISASCRGAPVPSITVPFLISRSQVITAPPSLLETMFVSRSAAARDCEKSCCRPASAGKPPINRKRDRPSFRCCPLSARRVQGRRLQRLTRQRYTLIKDETNQRQQREQDRDHEGAGRAVVMVISCATLVVEPCAQVHPNLLGRCCCVAQ